MSKDYSKINIDQFLIDFGIDHKFKGENIGRGWIGINPCPFCGAALNHFAVRRTDKRFSCWICGDGCDFGYYLYLLGYNKNEQQDIIVQYSNNQISFKEYERKQGKQVILPSELSHIRSEPSDPVINYLLSKGYTKLIVKQYQLMRLDMGSFLRLDKPIIAKPLRQDFQYRIFIPIYMNNRLVAYTARDWTDQQEPKYQHPVIEACIIPTGSCIYNYDSLTPGETNIIVEGPTDVWSMGSQTAALMGTRYSAKQIRFLAKKKMSHLIILFDEGAETPAKKLANAMTGFADKITICILKKGDPGDLSREEAIRLKQKLVRL